MVGGSCVGKVKGEVVAQAKVVRSSTNFGRNFRVQPQILARLNHGRRDENAMERWTVVMVMISI
jgi:hypothetical protein